MSSIFALTTRGIEEIVSQELQSLTGFSLKSTSYRRVSGNYEGDLEELTRVKTADDLFLQLAEWPDISHTRSMLPRFTDLARSLDLQIPLRLCNRFRKTETPPRFSISASFVGKRNYSSSEIKQACAEGLLQSSQGTYCEDDRLSDLNIRLFIEHDQAVVGVRLAQRPLHERAYKQHQMPGSLKPSVAAAMVRLAGLSPGDLVLDPCCGAGTIIKEALDQGAFVCGGDNNPDAIVAARLNVGEQAALAEWDARALPVSDQTINKVVTNLPWDRQIEIADHSQIFYRQLCREIERVLSPAGVAVILTLLPEKLHFEKLRCQREIKISLFGQTPTISIFAFQI